MMAGARGLRRFRQVIIGVIVLVIFCLGFDLAINAQQGRPGAKYTVIKAAFTTVGALQTGDDVRIATARIGRVDAVNFVNGTAEVTMRIEGRRNIYNDATASINERSGLGQKFVEVDPGTPAAGPLGPQAVIAVKTTVGAEELDNLLAVFDPATRQATGSFLREVGGGAAGHSQEMNDFLRTAHETFPGVGQVSTALSTNGGRDLVATLNSLDQLSQRFAGRQNEIAELVGQLGTTMDAVAADSARPLGQVLQDSPTTLRSLREAAQSLRGPLNDTAVAMTTLRTGARDLGAATPDIRGVLREARQPLGKAPSVDEQAEPSVDDLSNLFSDARPLAPRAGRALDSSDKFVGGLGPYAPEIAGFFTTWANALSHGDQNGHWLRLLLNFSEESAIGQGGVKDPVVRRDPYPAPGQAVRDGKTDSSGGGR
jgi:phospholipid/cholesterol/gamma-HCH transport system substrate-binding protein